VKFLFLFFCLERERERRGKKRNVFSLRFEEREEKVSVGGGEVRVRYAACEGDSVSD